MCDVLVMSLLRSMPILTMFVWPIGPEDLVCYTYSFQSTTSESGSSFCFSQFHPYYYVACSCMFNL